MKLIKSRVLIIGALLFALTGAVTQSEAEVSVNIGINLPPVRFYAPPAVVVIPGTYVYIVPDMDVDILFYQGYWWRPYEGRWYRSRNYEGNWNHVSSRRIPNGLRELPQDYRQRVSPEYERVHHKDVQKNWKKWEKEKYWDKRGDQDRGGHGDQDHRGGYGDQDRGKHGEQKKRY